MSFFHYVKRRFLSGLGDSMCSPNCFSRDVGAVLDGPGALGPPLLSGLLVGARLHCLGSSRRTFSVGHFFSPMSKKEVYGGPWLLHVAPDFVIKV